MAGQFRKLALQLVDVLHRQQFEIFIDAIRFFPGRRALQLAFDLLEDDR